LHAFHLVVDCDLRLTVAGFQDTGTANLAMHRLAPVQVRLHALQSGVRI